ncbi:hypothetical protein EV424DRAFT_1645863 [Suillus variegatus]|nr:hypothetical protein EV424DRAFT_1645863 [Suillus variegatus]
MYDINPFSCAKLGHPARNDRQRDEALIHWELLALLAEVTMLQSNNQDYREPDFLDARLRAIEVNPYGLTESRDVKHVLENKWRCPWVDMSREELWDYGCTFCCESEAYQIALPEGLSRRFPKPNNLKTAIRAAHVVLRDGFFPLELVLTGRIIGADEAERWGIVWVVREGSVADEAVKVASGIASKRPIAVNAGEDAVNVAV